VINARQVTLGPLVRPILPLEALRARLAQLLDGDPWLEAEDEDARLWRCILPGSTSGMLAMRANSERISTIETTPDRFPRAPGDGEAEPGVSEVTNRRWELVASSFWIVYAKVDD